MPTNCRHRFSPRERERIWDLACDGGEQPSCNICRQPVVPGQPWDVSHDPDGVPGALGGMIVGIAHARCNREHGARVVAPMVAKVKRQRQKHIGARMPGIGRHPMPCGRHSTLSKTMAGSVVTRTTQAEKLRATLARRTFGVRP